MPENIREIGMPLIMEGLFSYVMYEYFKIFFEKKNMKGIFLHIYVISIITQIVQSYIPDGFAYCRIILATGAWIVCSMFFIGGIGEKIIFSLLLVAMSMFGEALVGCAVLAFGMGEEKQGDIWGIVTYFILLVIVEVLKWFFKNEMVYELSFRTNLKMMILPIGSMFLAHRIFYAQYEMGIEGFYPNTILSILILLGLNVIVFNIYIQLSENMELQRKNAIFEKEFHLLEQHMHEREHMMQELRVKRHDLKHQMLNLLALLKNGDYKKLESDMEQIAELDSFNNLFVANTQNPIIDSFVNNKYAIASEKGIEFRVNIDIPVELPFAGEDLCVILGNALDNAIEACLRGTVKNPYISLKMIYDGKNLVIMIDNAFDGRIAKNKKGKQVSRKENNQQHGIGIYSIQRTVQKYHGYYHTEVKDNQYHLEIILYSKEANPSGNND